MDTPLLAAVVSGRRGRRASLFLAGWLIGNGLNERQNIPLFACRQISGHGMFGIFQRLKKG